MKIAFFQIFIKILQIPNTPNLNQVPFTAYKTHKRLAKSTLKHVVFSRLFTINVVYNLLIHAFLQFK